MNQEARDKLVEAELNGVRQVKGTFVNNDGRCALGVLGFSETNNKSLQEKYDFKDVAPTCPFLSTNLHRISCHWPITEMQLVSHLNDCHDLSFLDIARKFPESIESNG